LYYLEGDVVDIISVIILGLVQGFTEFLPISSSGHLVLASEILNFHEEGVAFEVFVHLGTLFSVLLAFRQDIFKMITAPYQVWIKGSSDESLVRHARWDIYVIIGTIPAALIGLMFKSEIEAVFSNVILVIVMLFVTGTFMILSRFVKNARGDVSYLRSFLIGCAQALAILPGISRSGSTIVTGMILGVDRSEAARFSFILSIPAILGATVLKTKDLLESQLLAAEWFYLVVGAFVAFISGYLAIIWLLDIVRKGKLEWFGYYCYLVVLVMSIWYFS
jgi:undecaprenyl-diphosphatase